MKKYELYMKPTMVWDHKFDYVCDSVTGVEKFLFETLELQYRDREVFVLIAVNTKCEIIGMNEISIGALDNIQLHPRELAKFLVLSNATAFIMAHNHPSGHVEPSEADLETTKKLMFMAQVMGIKMLDHIIVGGESSYSMCSNGIIHAMAKEAAQILENRC